MPIDVTSWFINQLDQTQLSPLARFEVKSGSGWIDKSAWVERYQTIARNAVGVIAGRGSVRVNNADLSWNGYVTSKDLNFKREARISVGLTHSDSGTEWMTIFDGLVYNPRLSQARADIGIIDRLRDLSDRFIGTRQNTVGFTGSLWNPADMFWTIVTSWGRLSSIASTSNPDIDYAVWLAWHGECINRDYVLRAVFTGESVVKAIRKLSDVTASYILAGTDGRLRPSFPVPAGDKPIFTEHNTLDIDVEVHQEDMFNRLILEWDYNTTSETFVNSMITASSSSQTVFGVVERVMNDTVIWHGNSASAKSFSDTTIGFRSNPTEQLRIRTPLMGARLVPGDVIQVTDSLYQWTGRPYGVTAVNNVDLDRGTAEFIAELIGSGNFGFYDTATDRMDGQKVVF